MHCTNREDDTLETTGQVKTERMQLGAEQFIGLFGIREENLSLFKDELGVELELEEKVSTVGELVDFVESKVE